MTFSKSQGFVCDTCGMPIMECNHNMTEIPNNRTVEMYRINEDRTWNTVMVELPANTHPNRLEEVARMHAVAQYGPAADYMLYNSMDDECPDVPHRSEIVVRLSFDIGQITEGSEAEQQMSAVEQINLALQRQPYGLGAQIFILDE